MSHVKMIQASSFDSTGTRGHELVGKQLFLGAEMISVYFMVT